MTGLSLECILMVGYAFALAIIALMLEWVGRHAHRRSLSVNTAGFTYHPGQDVWRCPRDQHLFPIFSDSAKGITIYRAPADACNSCISKAACTDSSTGREIRRSTLSDVESGIKKFHCAVSLTLLVLASLIIVIELFRTDSSYARVLFACALMLFFSFVVRFSTKLFQASQPSGLS